MRLKKSDYMRTMLKIKPLKAFNDNYIWLLHDGRDAVVVDPGQAEPVQQHLESHDLQLRHILITHHHADHIGGVQALLQAWDCGVSQPDDARIALPGRVVREGDRVEIPAPACQFTVLETPGHTRSHIVYYNPDTLFCGDTLFSLGCGRLFEGDGAQMLHSLNKIKRLPDETKVYCAHEYTLSNGRFAQRVEAGNAALGAHLEAMQQRRQADAPTVPTTLAQEKAMNPFLRTAEAAVIQRVETHVGHALADEAAVFTALRQWKDSA